MSKSEKWQLIVATPSWHFKRKRKVVPPWYQTGVRLHRDTLNENVMSFLHDIKRGETPSWHFKRRCKVVPPWYQTGIVNEAWSYNESPCHIPVTFWDFCVKANWNMFPVWNKLKLWRCETDLWVLNLHILISIDVSSI